MKDDKGKDIVCEFCGSKLTKEQFEDESMCDCYLYSQIKYWKEKYRKLKRDVGRTSND